MTSLRREDGRMSPLDGKMGVYVNLLDPCNVISVTHVTSLHERMVGM